ncbi:MAG TPA: xanthine dehydrogenase family protein subunit M [Candidatus Didemnitutus sp.]|nr:xanthine dehydrogenase family protein subunit M [Candidatus Didemnitutus sp.]
MNNFRYSRAGSEAEALSTMQRTPGAVFLGGGTNLIDYMKEGVLHPPALIDVRALSASITESNGGLRLGAGATNTAVANHPLVRDRYPCVSQALLAGASPQLRNVATVAGNILQRTRCPYFRDTAFDCNKRSPGQGCAAYAGFNRSHAVLGGSPNCIATHASDFCVALAAMDAVVLVTGPNGARRIPFPDFHVIPGETPERENVLALGELITAIDLPGPGAPRSCYVKVRDRASYEFALASAAVHLEYSGGRISRAAIALGGVATKPWRATLAENALTGKALTDAIFRAAAAAELAPAQPREHNEFKVALAQNVMVRALRIAAGQETAST